MSEDSSDSVLWLRALVSGDEAVVNEFWREYAAPIQRLAEHRMSQALKRRLGPDDILQSVGRTFFRRLGKGEYHFDKSDDVWRLLCAITLTKVRQHTRFHLRKRRGMDREVSLEGSSTGASRELENRAPAPGPTPAEAVEFADQMQHLCDALSEEERHVVLLKLEGLDGPGIAQRLECSERTVRRLLERVRKQWEKELGKSLGG